MRCFILFFLCWVSFAWADPRLAQALNRDVRVDGHSIVGVEVRNIYAGPALFAYHADRAMAPGSTMKVLTAEAALLYLGPQYTFKTQLFMDNTPIEKGVLTGNIYLNYSGDPTLTTKQLGQLIDVLRQKGVRQVRGNFYVDASHYDQDNRAPGWNPGDFHFCFSAPISAIIINRNCGYPFAVANTWRYNVSTLSTLLVNHGIQLRGKIAPMTMTKSMRLVASHTSAPLYKLVRTMLKRSDNVIAASIFKKVGEAYTKKPGSWHTGSIAVKAILEQSDHLDVRGIRIVDGSGLSHLNATSPHFFATLMQRAYVNAPSNRYFISALPIGGVDGTLHARLKNISGRVHAKTGTLSHVSSLSGYITTQHGHMIVFAIIINGSSPHSVYRQLEDRIVTDIYRYA